MHEHEHYQELMSRLLDDDLTPEEEASLREHVRVCRSCRQMFAAFTGMTGALRDEQAEAPRDLARGVMERIADETDQSPARVRRARRAGSGSVRAVSPWVRLTAAACLVLIAAGVVTAALRGGARRNGTESAERRAAETEQAGFQDAAEDADAGTEAGTEEDTASVPMMISTQDAAADGAQAAVGAVPEGVSPSGDIAAPSPEPEALPVYDAARNLIGTIPPENIGAFAALITDAGWPDGSAPDVQWEYLLKVEYLGKTYAFATDPDSGALVWWEDPSTTVIRSPGTLADLHELITTEPPALPQ